MITGSCLCKTNRFEVLGEAKRLIHCHCSICRKTNGGIFSTYLLAPGFRFIEGTAEDRRQYESSPGFHREFCVHCGSSLPERLNENLSFVPAGGLDDDLTLTPDCHTFVDSKAPWYTISDTLPQWPTYADRPTIAGTEQPSRSQRSGPETIGGSCHCDRVAFAIDGAPSLLMYCHCSRCRQLKAAPHATNLFVAADQFRWLRGEDQIVRYDLPGAARFGNSFCGHCGSSVPRQAQNAPIMVNIPAGSLDDAPGIEPKAHIFVGSKAPWDTISDALPQFAEMPSG